MVHSSDTEINEKLLLLKEMESILNVHINQIRLYQKSIKKLNMVVTSEVDENGVILYKLPNNTAGNEIDSDYRISQKDDLVVNIDNLLNKLNGFLA